MPSTYSAQDALNLVTQYAHGAPLSVPAAAIVDMVASAIWRYYPWGWSIASLTQTNLGFLLAPLPTHLSAVADPVCNDVRRD